MSLHRSCNTFLEKNMHKSTAQRTVDSLPRTDSPVSRACAPKSRNAMLLQGPIGPFFSRFAKDLTSHGFNVTKVNFNGGDRFFYNGDNAIDYTGAFKDWEAWIERVFTNCRIGRIYVFGDCRSYHRAACKVAERLNIKVFVFEEGYIRPNFITLEEGGVNGHSSMMLRPFHPSDEIKSLPAERVQPKFIFYITALYSMVYYMASAAQRSRFTEYRHHRTFDCISEGLCWIRSGLRKWRYARLEKDVLNDVITLYDGNYFVCPLQVHCDMQVIAHSDYNSIEHFIGDVLASFREHADSNKAIVFKHHPLDRGYTDYSMLFGNLVAELGLQGRVFYVHDVDLPTLLKHAQGTVLINSTVGMSSLFHGAPVKTMGKAIYDVPGLTAQESLDEFWSCTRQVNKEIFQRFRSFLINRNQLNGNLYRRISGQGASGVVWSADLAQVHSWTDDFLDDREIIPELELIEVTEVAQPDDGKDDSAKAA